MSVADYAFYCFAVVTVAAGLAEAKVKEADAIASEKHGLAQVRVKEAEAQVIATLRTPTEPPSSALMKRMDAATWLKISRLSS